MRQGLISILATAIVLTTVPPIPAAEPESPHDEPARQSPRQSMAPRQSMVPHPLTTAEAQVLIGRSVTTTDGTSGGEIRDFTLAGPDGRIAQVVIGSGGILGFGRKLTAVPADQLHIHGPRQITVDMTAAELEAAPGFRYDTQTKAMIGPKP